MEDNKCVKINVVSLVTIMISAVIAITICSKSSPLYPFNDWMDINCFMTVGKSLIHGVIPYKDIYEQKGPLLYLICAVAATISDTNFIGFYIVELIAAFFFLFYSYKIMRVFCENNALLLIPVLAFAVYSCGSFSHGGSAEELCLPFLVYALWIGTKLVVYNKRIGHSEAFLIGLTSGAILWIKYSMLGFYIGWIIIPAYLMIKKREIKELFVIIGLIICGVIVISLPVICYLYANNAIEDCFIAYFYNNIFIYSGAGEPASKIKNILSGIHLSLVYAPIPIALISVGVLILIKSNIKAFLFFALTGFCMAVVVFSGGQGILYYPLAITAITPVGLSVICNCIIKGKILSEKRQQTVAIGLLALCSVGCLLCSSNTYFMSYEKSDLPQYQFKDIICKKDNPTLLNYGFMDGGFYTSCDLEPTCKYFCKLNIDLEESRQMQDEYVEKGYVDFIVTRNDKPNFELYDCVAQSSYWHEGREQTYYLYEIKEPMNETP